MRIKKGASQEASISSLRPPMNLPPPCNITNGTAASLVPCTCGNSICSDRFSVCTVTEIAHDICTAAPLETALQEIGNLSLSVNQYFSAAMAICLLPFLVTFIALCLFSWIKSCCGGASKKAKLERGKVDDLRTTAVVDKATKTKTPVMAPMVSNPMSRDKKKETKSEDDPGSFEMTRAESFVDLVDSVENPIVINVKDKDSDDHDDSTHRRTELRPLDPRVFEDTNVPIASFFQERSSLSWLRQHLRTNDSPATRVNVAMEVHLSSGKRAGKATPHPEAEVFDSNSNSMFDLLSRSLNNELPISLSAMQESKGRSAKDVITRSYYDCYYSISDRAEILYLEKFSNNMKTRSDDANALTLMFSCSLILAALIYLTVQLSNDETLSTQGQSWLVTSTFMLSVGMFVTITCWLRDRRQCCGRVCKRELLPLEPLLTEKAEHTFLFGHIHSKKTRKDIEKNKLVPTLLEPVLPLPVISSAADFDRKIVTTYTKNVRKQIAFGVRLFVEGMNEMEEHVDDYIYRLYKALILLHNAGVLARDAAVWYEVDLLAESFRQSGLICAPAAVAKEAKIDVSVHFTTMSVTCRRRSGPADPRRRSGPADPHNVSLDKWDRVEAKCKDWTKNGVLRSTPKAKLKFQIPDGAEPGMTIAMDRPSDDMDNTFEEVRKEYASIQIQALWRGYMERIRFDKMIEALESQLEDEDDE